MKQGGNAMSNELVEKSESIGVPTIIYSREQVDLIKRTYATEATDDELALFIHASKRLSLDILARQIHFTKRAGKVVFIVSIDGYRLNAERTGNYAPGKEPTFTYDDKKNVVSATAYGKKFIKGEWHEVAATAFMSEYKPDEKSDWMWKKMPHNQLAKCAEALMLRRAFPKDLGDTVTDVEMAQVREPKNQAQAKPPIQQPVKKAEPAADAIEVVETLIEKTTKRKINTSLGESVIYTIYGKNGQRYETYDEATAKKSDDLKGTETVVRIGFVNSPYGPKLKTFTVVDQPVGA